MIGGLRCAGEEIVKCTTTDVGNGTCGDVRAMMMMVLVPMTVPMILMPNMMATMLYHSPCN